MPGAWAPSTSVSMPRAVELAGRARRSGKMRAVGLVTWLIRASFVRGRDAGRGSPRVTCAGVADREGDLGDDDPRAGALGGERRGIAARRCTRGRRPGSRRRARSRSDRRTVLTPIGGVRDEGEVVRIGTDERRPARLGQRRGVPRARGPGSRPARPRAGPARPAGPPGRARAGPERAVVEERHRRVERPGGAVGPSVVTCGRLSGQAGNAPAATSSARWQATRSAGPRPGEGDRPQELRLLRPAALDGDRAARVEATARRAGGWDSGPRPRAGSGGARARSSGPGSAPPRTARACTGAAATGTAHARSAVSATRPRYITTTRWHMLPMTARSCPISR